MSTFDEKTTNKDLPVLIGDDYQHVMGRAVIVQHAPVRNHFGDITEPAKVEITIVSEGNEAQVLGDYVAANEIVALSFMGVPVRPHTKET